jgi:hypothetical protein
MVAHGSSSTNTRREGFAVAAPQAGDTLKDALRCAYQNPRGMPDDMMDLLIRMDDAHQQRR